MTEEDRDVDDLPIAVEVKADVPPRAHAIPTNANSNLMILFLGDVLVRELLLCSLLRSLGRY